MKKTLFGLLTYLLFMEKNSFLVKIYQESHQGWVQSEHLLCACLVGGRGLRTLIILITKGWVWGYKVDCLICAAPLWLSSWQYGFLPCWAGEKLPDYQTSFLLIFLQAALLHRMAINHRYLLHLQDTEEWLLLFMVFRCCTI